MRTAFRAPSFVAQADTLWTLFTSHDDNDDARGNGTTTWKDGNWEVWFRKSFPMDAVIASGQSVEWSGLVYLDRDVLVEPGGTLSVEPGTVVVVKPLEGQENQGLDTERVELVVRGTLQVNGAAPHSVRFESAGGTAGDWGGILFDVAAAPAGYGYATNSSITGAEINDATQGLMITKTGAPSLDGLTFSNIDDDRHVVLGSDVYVPNGGHWILMPGTVVKAAPTSAVDINGLNLGKVDIVVHGWLYALGDFFIGVPPDTIRFEPTVIPPATEEVAGDSWGGIFFDWQSAGSAWARCKLSHVDIGYAYTPMERPPETDPTRMRVRYSPFGDGRTLDEAEAAHPLADRDEAS
jgi:hypothetical protein